MNFVEFVEKYQQEMAPEQMLAIAKAIGKCLSYKLSDDEVHHLCAMVYGVLSEEHFDKHFADDAISKMWYEDADGNKHTAPFFSDVEIKDAFDKHKDDISDYTIHDTNSFFDFAWCCCFRFKVNEVVVSFFHLLDFVS